MTYENEFNAAVEFTLKQEGVLSDNPNDAGGLTKYGITQTTWEAWSMSQPNAGKLMYSVSKITVDQAIAVYHDQYWRGDLPRELQLPFFDLAVNSGPDRAVKMLQGLLGVTQDGAIGPLTIAKLAALQAGALRRLRNDYVTARIIFLADLAQHNAKDVTFIEGWERRVTKLYDFAY